MKKQIFYFSLLACTSIATTTSAQNTTKEIKELVKFSIGLHSIAMNSPSYIVNTDLHSYGFGLNARLFLGKRLALSTQINALFSEKTFYYFPSIMNSSYSRNSIDIPLQIEYHLMPHSKIRPYFGAGVGVSKDYIKHAYQNSEHNFKEFTFPYFQISQGITFDVGKHLQINQSLFYRYNMDSGKSSIGISIGIGIKY